MTIRLSHGTARVIGALGRTLITLGVITFLFVAYQLWGTGIQQARSQDRLGSEFESRMRVLEQAGLGTPATLPSEGDDPRDGAGTDQLPSPGPTTTEPPSLDELDPEVLAALTPVQGEPVAQIKIDSIDVDETVVYGIRVSDLRKGPGVFPSNPMPGTSGNAAIAGHRTTWGEPFHDLDQVHPGDEIVVSTLQGEFTYVVDGHRNQEGDEVGHFIVPESGVHILEDFGDDRITLVACHPKFSSRQRIVVTGQLVEPPVDPPPTTVPSDHDNGEGGDHALGATSSPAEWDEGLGGDSTALVPTVVWGALFTAALLGAVAIGHYWRRLPTYALSAPVLMWLLWTTFVYLDQLIPSY